MDSIHHDIILTNILPYLNGPSLASLSSTSSNFHHLISSNTYNLWSNLCLTTWPSLNTPRLCHVISTFKPEGPRSFFSQAYASDCFRYGHKQNGRRLQEFVSAVDIRYEGNLIFSETVETVGTETSWFRSAPFRVDMLDVKKSIVQFTKLKHPTTDNACIVLLHDLTLSWIVIDPTNGLAVNLSSGQPVSVERHWLSGEVIVKFCTILSGVVDELVKCGIRLTLSGSEGGEMEVREVSLVMEDMDGKHLSGEGSLVNLEWALHGNKRRSYEEFLEKKRERKVREVRREQKLDLFCLSFGATIILSTFLLFLFMGN